MIFLGKDPQAGSGSLLIQSSAFVRKIVLSFFFFKKTCFLPKKNQIKIFCACKIDLKIHNES